MSPRGTRENVSARSITLLTNGPGELWGWVRPFAAELLRRGWEVSLRILPCQFASGEERRIALSLGIADVSGPEGSARTALSLFKRGRGADGKRPDAVVQLGGDLLWGRMLASSCRAPLYCYSYGRKKGMERCTAVFTAYPEMARAIGRESIHLVGDLVADALEGSSDACVHEADAEGRWPKVAFFPGSRGAIRKFAIPLIQETAAALRERFPALDARVLLSPFASDEEKREFRSFEGLLPVRGGSADALRGIDFAVTQPGTNTLELMHCSVPFLLSVPFSSLRHIPLSGAVGAICGLPLLGSALREAYLRSKSRRTGFLAWPNRLAGRALVDELIGDISAQDIARRVAERLADDEYLAETREAFAKIVASAPRGAAASMADHIERMLAER